MHTDAQKLVELAFAARERAYAPYSQFKVGAALLAADGSVFLGCNIENAAFSPTNCAERTAFFNAVSQGVRDFAAIAIVGFKDTAERRFAAPCGVCRQVMMEFCNPDSFSIILAKDTNDYQIFTLRDLLPLGFGPDNL